MDVDGAGRNTAAGWDRPGGRRPYDDELRGSRWKMITQEELFQGSGNEAQRSLRPSGDRDNTGKGRRSQANTATGRQSQDSTVTGRRSQDGQKSRGPALPERFSALIRMLRPYQTTENGRREAFLKQAKWMESYEAEGEIPDLFFYHQYVGYQEMDPRELQGYFVWRTRFRRNERVPCCFEYMRLHATELVNLIGVGSMKEAFDSLLRLQAVPMRKDNTGQNDPSSERNPWQVSSVQFRAGMDPWGISRAYHQKGLPERRYGMSTTEWRRFGEILSGFVISWGPDPELIWEYCVPDMECEIENITLLHYEGMNDAALYRVIHALAESRTAESRFMKEIGEDGHRVIARVFRRLCREQKEAGTDVLSEKLLGERRTRIRSLFPMIPYETRVKDGYFVEVSPATFYAYKDGVWQHSSYPAMRDSEAIRKLSALVRECERVLRIKLRYKNKLPDKLKDPKLANMISEETDRWMKEKELRNRPEVHVDLSKLGTIRNLAAITQERLLEGTEEGLEADALNIMMNGPDTAEETAAGRMGVYELPGEPAVNAEETESSERRGEGPEESNLADTVCEGGEAKTPADAAGEGSIFTPEESEFLRRLLAGESAGDFFREHRILPSVFVDAINEKAYEEIGDSIVEEDGSGWQLVEDYIEEVRELLEG